jgi:YhcH/YjgK/YiaL family protein
LGILATLFFGATRYICCYKQKLMKLKLTIAACIIILGAANINAKKFKRMKTTTEAAKEWFSSKAYLKGSAVVPHDSVNQLAFYEHYQKFANRWDAALKFLDKDNLDTISPGKYKLLGDDVVAMVTEGTTRPFGDTKWEYHHKFIDLQYIYRGVERMGVAPIADLKQVGEYNEDKDVGFGDVDGGSYFDMDSKSFQLFFPSDAHRPNISVAGNDQVKKIVVKIKFD